MRSSCSLGIRSLTEHFDDIDATLLELNRLFGYFLFSYSGPVNQCDQTKGGTSGLGDKKQSLFLFFPLLYSLLLFYTFCIVFLKIQVIRFDVVKCPSSKLICSVFSFLLFFPCSFFLKTLKLSKTFSSV